MHIIVRTKRDNSSIKLILNFEFVFSYLGTRRSESIQSSNSPSNTAETSTYGSQTVKPLPIKSMAARRMGEYAGNFLLGGCCKRNVKALPELKNVQNCSEILVSKIIVSVVFFFPRHFSKDNDEEKQLRTLH